MDSSPPPVPDPASDQAADTPRLRVHVTAGLMDAGSGGRAERLTVRRRLTAAPVWWWYAPAITRATGVLVSEFALGTMTFGKESDERAAHAILDHYVEAGGNLVDSADVYQQGVAEELLG